MIRKHHGSQLSLSGVCKKRSSGPFKNERFFVPSTQPRTSPFAHAICIRSCWRRQRHGTSGTDHFGTSADAIRVCFTDDKDTTQLTQTFLTAAPLTLVADIKAAATAQLAQTILAVAHVSTGYLSHAPTARHRRQRHGTISAITTDAKSTSHLAQLAQTPRAWHNWHRR